MSALSGRLEPALPRTSEKQASVPTASMGSWRSVVQANSSPVKRGADDSQFDQVGAKLFQQLIGIRFI